MKNTENGERFILAHNGDTSLILVQYSTSGLSTYAYHGFSNNVLAKAGGGGYCKTSTVLSDAIEKLTGIAVGGRGQGVDVVSRLCTEHNITLYQWHDLLRLVHEDIAKPERTKGIYPVVANALRTSATKARAIVYGTESAAITNEAVAMTKFVDNRMHRDEIMSKLADIL